MSIVQNPLRSNHVFKAEHYEELRKLFPKQEVTPSTSLQEVYYQAGIEKVLAEIARKVQNA